MTTDIILRFCRFNEVKYTQTVNDVGFGHSDGFRGWPPLG